jgi:hypothetical protein
MRCDADGSRCRQVAGEQHEVGAHHRIGSRFDAVGQFLERQLSFACGLAQTVHRGVAVGVGGSNVHQAANQR